MFTVKLLHKALVSGFREPTLLIQKGENTHGLFLEERGRGGGEGEGERERGGGGRNELEGVKGNIHVILISCVPKHKRYKSVSYTAHNAAGDT